MSDDVSEMSIQAKILRIRKSILEAHIKKTGESKFHKSNYFTLDDIVPIIVELCVEYNLFTLFSFTNERAILSVQNIDNFEDTIIEVESPMPELHSVKGKDLAQTLGSYQTYLRRYLYLALFDIVEVDDIEENQSESTNNSTKNKTNDSKKNALSVDDKDVLNFYDSLCEDLKEDKKTIDNNSIWSQAKKREKTDPEGVTIELLKGLRGHLQTLGGK